MYIVIILDPFMNVSGQMLFDTKAQAEKHRNNINDAELRRNAIIFKACTA